MPITGKPIRRPLSRQEPGSPSPRRGMYSVGMLPRRGPRSRTRSPRPRGRARRSPPPAVLARAAGLLLVGVVELGALGDRLAVGHLGLARSRPPRCTRASCARRRPRGAARPCPRSRSRRSLVDAGPEGRVLRVKRPRALDRLSWAFCSFTETESEITGSGTCIELMATSMVPSVKVSPDAHSMPNSATMSPAPAALDVLHLVGVHAHQAPDLVALLAGCAAVDDGRALGGCPGRRGCR